MSQPLEFVSLEEIKSLPLRLDHVGFQKVHGVLNELLVRVHNKAVENMLLSMPEWAVLLLKRTADMEKIKADFLAAHGDLATSPEFFEALAEKEAEHPGWPYDQLLDEAAAMARVRIKAGITMKALGQDVPAEKPTLAAADEALNGVL